MIREKYDFRRCQRKRFWVKMFARQRHQRTLTIGIIVNLRDMLKADSPITEEKRA